MIPVPDIANTTSIPVPGMTHPLVCAVIITTHPLSRSDPVEMLSRISGTSSSSIIFIVVCCIPSSAPLVTESIATTTVSVPSTRASWSAVMVVVTPVAPAGIVTSVAAAV